MVEKITRTIYFPCRRLSLKHQVVFGKKNKNDQRRMGELSSFGYNSDKYSDIQRLETLVLETSDYLMLELRTDKESENMKVLISYPHLNNMKKGLKAAVRWFNSSAYKTMFVEKGGDLLFNSEFDNEAVLISGLVGGAWIRLVPEIIECDSELFEGVAMYVNSEMECVYLSADQLEALYQFLNSFDLYSASQLLINYVQLHNSTNGTAATSTQRSSSGRSQGNVGLARGRGKSKKGEDE